MKNSLIALIALVVMVSLVRSASADTTIEPYKNVVELTVHMNVGYQKPWIKTFKFDKPTNLVLKPCSDGHQSNCLYVVSKNGHEKEYYSFTADESNFVTYHQVTR